MQTETLLKLIDEIKRQKTEKQNVELKCAESGCPTKLYDTLSSFSNQDEGGIILFGVDEKNGYAVKGVYDAQDLQKKVTEQCKQMEPPVRALFSICEYDGKIVVAAEIPGVDGADRPVYYKGVGRIKGSYVRVGESDEPMSEYEIYGYEAFRKRIREDMRPVESADFSLLHQERLSDYLSSVKKERKNLAENVSDGDILELMGVCVHKVPTVACVLTFSLFPQAFFPQWSITAVSLPGTEMGETGVDGERFLDSQRITGAIPDMLEEAVEFVRKNSRIKTIIDENGKRTDKQEYPLLAVREAVLNALVHRDYSIHTENTPVCIEMYRDRMEITNSGGLYGKITVDNLGKIRPETRNATLANILELLKVTENRYSGIPTMRKACAEAGLPAPEFSVSRGEFKVVFRNTYYPRTPTVEDIVEFCATPKTRAELIAFTGKSRVYTIQKMIEPLVQAGKLRLTLPDKPKSVKQKFVKNDR